VASSGGIKDTAKERSGVEARDAQPDDGAVAADQCRCRPIANKAMVPDREIAIYVIEGCERRERVVYQFKIPSIFSA
jgi:hypothetical protein